MTLYEIGKNGMERINADGKNDIPVGTVLHWGGNQGYPPEDFVICKNLGISKGCEDHGTKYLCVALKDNRQKEINAYEIKTKDDETRHKQYIFLTDRKLSLDEVDKYYNQSIKLKKDEEEKRLNNENIQKEKIKIGKELFKKHIPENAKALIVAELEVWDGDSQTDYYSTKTDKTVILGYSKHTRDLFSEMRKYASLLPETAHLGKGKGHFEPMVIIGKDFETNGCSYYKGNYSHWHRELTEKKDGKKIVFSTKEEAEKYIKSKGDPESIWFDGKEVSFTWDIKEEDIEHREKYSMGAGYYLKDATRYDSGWKINKVCSYESGWSDYLYIAMAERCIFEDPKPEKQKAKKSLTWKSEEDWQKLKDNPVKNNGVIIAKNEKLNGLEVKFSSKPSEEIIRALKEKGFRWSRFNKLWYNRYSEELKNEIESMLKGMV